MSSTNIKRLTPQVFLLCLAPLLLLGLQAFSGQFNSAPLLSALHQDTDLGANPIQNLTFTTGDSTLTFLCITLAITPLRRLTGLAWLIKFRRMLGLFAFFFGCLHFSIYWIDLYYGAKNIEQSLTLAAVFKDVAKRPFITAGFTALVLMAPLAITSTAGWIRRLGGKRWQQLHRLIYASAVAGVVHYWWQVKSDISMPLLYGTVVAVLIGYRVVYAMRKGPAAAPIKATAED